MFFLSLGQEGFVNFPSVFSGSVKLAKIDVSKQFYESSLSAKFVVLGLICSLESLHSADL